MKVAHFSDRFYPSFGGIQVHIEAIIEYMKDLEFTIITDHLKATTEKERFSPNCKIIRFKPRSIISNTMNKFYFPQRIQATRKRHKKKIDWLNSSDLDIVHVHGPAIGMDIHKIDGILGKQLLSKPIEFSELKKPKIMTMHGLFSPYKQSKFFLEFEKRFLSDFKTIICVDKSICQYSKSIAKSGKFHFIPNSVDTDKFKFTQIKIEDDINIGYIGRPDPYRGYEMVQKLGKNLPKGHTLTLIIADPLEKPTGLKESKKIKVHYNLKQDDIITHLKKMDLVLNPLRIPVISRVTLESLAIGRPIITTNKANIHPIINEETGFVIRNRLDDLIRLLKKIKAGKYDLSKIGKKGHEIVNKEFSHKIIMPKIQKIYERVENQ